MLSLCKNFTTSTPLKGSSPQRPALAEPEHRKSHCRAAGNTHSHKAPPGTEGILQNSWTATTANFQSSLSVNTKAHLSAILSHPASLFHLGRQLHTSQAWKATPKHQQQGISTCTSSVPLTTKKTTLLLTFFNLHGILNTTNTGHQNTSCTQRWGSKSQEHALHAHINICYTSAYRSYTENLGMAILTWMEEIWTLQAKHFILTPHFKVLNILTLHHT